MPTRTWDEGARFCDRVARHPLFVGAGPVSVARAPGRFDVLGGIADYSGSLVLGLPTAAAAFVAVQLTDDGRAIAISASRRVSLGAAELVDLPLECLARRFSGAGAWAAYVLGPIALLARAPGACLSGVRVLVCSSIPEAIGLGSSAALGVATLQAVASSLGRREPIAELALIAQQAEQLVARAPCGPMDQLTVALGEPGRLLTILCRPAEVVASLLLPEPLAVWGIDSGSTHAISGPGYRRVRCATFIGKALLGRRGHLAGIAPSEVDMRRLPEQMPGRDFLTLRMGVDDPFSVVEPDVVYPVRAATLHPIEEHVRVGRFAELITKPVTDESARSLGELMYESNAGYRRCGLGTPTTDAVVAEVRRAGWTRGLAGARVSGGGDGGTVVVLGHRDAEPLVAEIANDLGAGYVGGSSAGAAAFGVRTVLPAH